MAWQVGERKLRVSFLPLPVSLLKRLPFLSAPCNIVHISDDYRYAVVRSGRLWWILAREKNISDTLLKQLLRYTGLSSE